MSPLGTTPDSIWMTFSNLVSRLRRKTERDVGNVDMLYAPYLAARECDVSRGKGKGMCVSLTGQLNFVVKDTFLCQSRLDVAELYLLILPV
jgi:hypothetical protein